MAAHTVRRPRRAAQQKENKHKDKHTSKDETVTSSEYQYQPWTPTAYTAFKLLLSIRLCAAIWSNISDCDEVFNYWEPMHYILNGNGFQTWEYSPRYAIRSYAYLWLYILPIKIYTTIFNVNKILQFYFLRCVMGFICTACEIYFYRIVCKKFGGNTGLLTISCMLLSSGMYISSTALLPSTLAMYCTMISMAAWWSHLWPVAILATAVSALLGWPFAAVIGLPIAYDYVIRKKCLWEFIKWSFISFLICMFPLLVIDSHYYGGIVIAPLNIVLYNVFSDHGPDLYGVEPVSYYLMNGFLNFNFAFPLALISFPLVFLTRKFLAQPDGELPIWLPMAPLYLWIAIFFSQPHKEERFLFPIYPLICFTASLALDHIQKLWSYLFRSQQQDHYTQSSSWIAWCFMVSFGLLSFSRTIALYKGYHAPLDTYGDLHRIAEDVDIHSMPADKNVSLCVGKEWYRFPSSFFLPSDRWHLEFIKSEFKGQLPKQYGSGPLATQKTPKHMNDLNLEETSRYVDISQCHYLIDLDIPQTSKFEPRYSELTEDWEIITSTSFLYASKSPALLRAFYIPFLTENHCHFINYNILKSLKQPVNTGRERKQKQDI